MVVVLFGLHVVGLRRGDPLWTIVAWAPLSVLIGWNLLAAFDSDRQARKLRSMRDEVARLEREIAARRSGGAAMEAPKTTDRS